MNIGVESSNQAIIQREAREWLMRLDGDTPLGAEETIALREWLCRSRAHRAELKRIGAFWNRANVLTELAVPLQRAGAPTSSAARRMPLGPRTAAAATLACMMIAFAAWWLKPTADANGAYGTAIGQQRTLSLVDGSSVQINTDSQVQVDYNEHVRKIRLLRGEAFFTVAPNASRPFEVFAASGVVKAIGTAFAVSVQGAELSITVSKGRVDVATTESEGESGVGGSLQGALPVHPLASLKAGQTATYSRGRTIEAHEISEPELRRRLSWHEGYLVYSGQPLDEVVADINRYSSVTLEIVDPRLNALAIGGRFKVGDVEAIYDVLQSNFGIRIVRVDDRHIQLRLAPSH